MKGQSGITLVALIITIIVLLILAMVTITAVIDDGIIDHAKTSTETYKTNADAENKTIENYVNFLDTQLKDY